MTLNEMLLKTNRKLVFDMDPAKPSEGYKPWTARIDDIEARWRGDEDCYSGNIVGIGDTMEEAVENLLIKINSAVVFTAPQTFSVDVKGFGEITRE